MDRSRERDALERARSRALPAQLLSALEGMDAYLVGGAVRDALLGGPLGDVDVAIDGELEPVLARLGVEAKSHQRFATATVSLAQGQVDLARTRRERYPSPGALPVVEPAPIQADLARRDFTVNAMAVPLFGELELIDPYDGAADLERGVLRAIHPQSFADDPTRALRAARYAARLGLRPEPETERLLRAADLGTVSSERVAAELARIAAEPGAALGFELLADWGLLELDPGRLRLLAAAAKLLEREPWRGLAPREELLPALATAPAARLARAQALTDADPAAAASELFELAHGSDPLCLLAARAAGAIWLDRYLTEWRQVRLAIDGRDLLAAGVPEGPEIGRALRATLRGRIDGAVASGPEGDLEGCRRWSGASETECAGCRPSCPGPPPRSRPGPAGSASRPGRRSTWGS